MSMQPTSAASSPRAKRVAFPALVALALGAALGAGCGPKYPACEDDKDCHVKEFCVNKQCQQCREDANCEQGQSCNAGRCDDIVGYCDQNVACPSGQECVGNRCQAPQTEPLERPAPVSTGCQLQTVYFAFDSSNLEPSARDVIAKNAQCVREKSMTGVRITGYTDDRGTEEYNLALGDRRARSVAQYMGSLGVEKGKLTPASMGEELARGADESGWAQDRKVEFATR
jgi:peptidoglycan-associated lipoprotein